MKKYTSDILLSLAETPLSPLQSLSEQCGISPDTLYDILQSLRDEGFLNDNNTLTAKAHCLLAEGKPMRAIILAAGFGMRMVPINSQTPKAFLRVQGEVLIERLIRQLHNRGIREIYVVVGFMKERFAYLEDTFGVRLLYNPQYALKNNLHSLSLAAEHISNAYIIPCDLWCRHNPFRRNELYSWYMVSEEPGANSNVIRTETDHLVKTSAEGNRMIGISYLTGSEAVCVKNRLAEMASREEYDGEFWEATLYENRQMITYANVVPEDSVAEISTYEQLRALDANSESLKSDAIGIIQQVLSVQNTEIKNITVLKKGMTNRSFLFQCGNKKYIMRIPGEGTDKLISRQNEAAVYSVLEGKDICDNVIYINPNNGYKITEFLESARVCDPFCTEDVQTAMDKLRYFHHKKIRVPHTFEIFEQILYYESLRGDTPSCYGDYTATKDTVFSLRAFVEEQSPEYCLTHIDAVADNFLFVPREDGTEDVRLIDWEYAGMQDPHVDIAMFCIYAMYDRKHIDSLIDIYFENRCSDAVRAKIYCYISACGLLWSNWCEYKSILGVDFGEYALQQYLYAKEYADLAITEISKLKEQA